LNESGGGKRLRLTIRSKELAKKPADKPWVKMGKKEIEAVTVMKKDIERMINRLLRQLPEGLGVF
jgi:hypothetical protein